jgi:hypothetical protein
VVQLFGFSQSHFHQEGNSMPQDRVALASLVERFKKGEPVPLECQLPDFLAEHKRLSKLGQLAEVSPDFFHEVYKTLENYPPVHLGKRWFICSGHEFLPLWLFFEKPGRRRWLFFRARRYFCRQLTWEESDLMAAALGIQPPRPLTDEEE